jgi:hypothetical protein
VQLPCCNCVSPLHLRVNVDRTTLCFCAILDHGIPSLDAKVTHSASASCNPIALCCSVAAMIEVFWWFSALRKSAHYAHRHGTEVSQKCLITVLSEIGFHQVQLHSGVRHNTSRDHDAPLSRSGTSVDLLAHVQSRAQHFSTRKIHPSI